MMDTHESYEPIPEPPKTGVQVAIILCGLLLAAIAVYKVTTGHW